MRWWRSSAVGIVTGALVAAGALVGSASASPPSVDNVVAVIGRNAQAGKWGLAEKNIESLRKTIRNELTSNRTPVAIAANPIAPLAQANAARIAALKADYGVLLDALRTLQNAQKKATTAAIAAVAEAIETRIPAIVGGADALQAIPSVSDAKEIGAKIRTMRSLDKAVRYVNGLMKSLRPAIHEATSDRDHLATLNARFTAALARYGLTAGGPAVQPSASGSSGSGSSSGSAYPKIGGVWFQEQYCDPTGGSITIGQSSDGTVSSLLGSWPACPATERGSNFRWESATMLVYDVVNAGPAGWAPRGGHRVTFAADGRTASCAWWDSYGNSGTVAWSRVS
jgi:hypothetical protein